MRGRGQGRQTPLYSASLHRSGSVGAVRSLVKTRMRATNSQGCRATEEEAANNLNEAVQIFLSTCYEMGTLNAVLKECGLKPKELLRFFELNGWQRHGQEGSHVKMTKAGALRPIIVPVGTREVSQHVLRTNLATAQITVAEYRRLTERK